MSSRSKSVNRTKVSSGCALLALGLASLHCSASPGPWASSPPLSSFSAAQPLTVAPATGTGALGTRESLRGEIYDLPPDTKKLPDFDKLRSVGTIYAPTLVVPERDFKEGFPGVTDRFEWFAIDYRGAFLVPTAAKYTFRLTSDDGAKLFIDDEQVIDNDGVHPSATAQGTVELAAGPHRLRLPYFQGPRFGISLILEVSVSGGPMHPFDAHASSPMESAREDRKIRVTLDGSLLFDTDHDNLKPEAESVLGQIKMSLLDLHPEAHVIVEGHTDDVGTDEHNDALSQGRAHTVVSWLVQHGSQQGSLEARGYGKRWSRVPNTSAENRAKNRRVEIVLVDVASSSTTPARTAPTSTTAPPVTTTPPPGDMRPDGCPVHYEGIVGKSCLPSQEGKFCGPEHREASDGWVNSTQCSGGVWTTREAPPRPR